MSAPTVSEPMERRASAAPSHLSVRSDDGRGSRLAVALCGLLGVVLLGVYYSVPMPLPLPTAPIREVVAFSIQYRDRILLDAWLQASGSLLAVIFFVAVVRLTHGFERLAGWVTLIGAGSVLAMSLLDVALAIGAVQGAALGHVATVQTCFDLTFVFVHLFPIGPAAVTFFGLGGVLRRSTILPRGFAYAALAMAALFSVLGFVGLFQPAVNGVVVVLLSLQEFWIGGAAVLLLLQSLRATIPETV